MNAELSVRIWISPGFDVLDVRSVNADWNIMLGFTCHCAGMATNTGSVINNEAEIGHHSITPKGGAFVLFTQPDRVSSTVITLDR